MSEDSKLTEQQRKTEAARQRKAASRAKLARFNIKVVEVKLSESERNDLDAGCEIRGGEGEPYDRDEYISTLIRNDKKKIAQQLNRMGQCKKCKEKLPGGCNGLFTGDSTCERRAALKRLAL